MDDHSSTTKHNEIYAEFAECTPIYDTESGQLVMLRLPNSDSSLIPDDPSSHTPRSSVDFYSLRMRKPSNSFFRPGITEPRSNHVYGLCGSRRRCIILACIIFVIALTGGIFGFIFSRAKANPTTGSAGTGSAILPRIGDNLTTIAGSGRRGSLDGPSNNATFDRPWGVAVGPDNSLYISDYGSNKIRIIGTDNHVHTFAGSGTAQLNDGIGNPAGIAFDADGNLIVADSGSNCIRIILKGGQVQTLAGIDEPGATDGVASVARFFNPSGVAVSKGGEIYVADTGNAAIRKITSSGDVSTFAGRLGEPGARDGAPQQASFRRPFGIFFDSVGNLIVADSGNNKIRSIDIHGTVTTIAGSGARGEANSENALQATFSSPIAAVMDQSGYMYISDTTNSLIRVRSPTGLVSTWAGTGVNGSGDGFRLQAALNMPASMAIDVKGVLIVADRGSNKVRSLMNASI